MVYQSKLMPFAGADYQELVRQARKEYHAIQNQTPRRQPYIRAQYFAKGTVFINSFWEHLSQKAPRDQRRRLKFFTCAIDLICHTTVPPTVKQDMQQSRKMLYRFEGATANGEHYFVQIREDRRTGRKDFVSVFPAQ